MTPLIPFKKSSSAVKSLGVPVSNVANTIFTNFLENYRPVNSYKCILLLIT
jgi:hypothetical protein